MIHPVSDVALDLVPGGWPLDAATAARVADHWAATVAVNPQLWDGLVLNAVAPGLDGGLRVADGVLRGTLRESRFSQFLAWRDWGFPDMGIRNLFGSALVMSADGALIYGLMGSGTANAGRIYPPGGNLEPADVDGDGRIDIVGSILRELAEETGLDGAEAEVEGQFAAFAGPLVSVGRVLRFADDAPVLVARIEAFLEAQDVPELDGVRVFRRASDLEGENVPQYARMYAERLLPA